MMGWLVVLGSMGAVAATARWYVHSTGVAGYRGDDAARVARLRL